MNSAARDLMDTGTPGPWHALPGDDTFNPSVGAVPEAFPSLLSSDEWVAECKPAGDADANKIVLSVNALPLVDALIEATKTHMKFAYVSRTMQPDRQTPYCRQCGRAWPCPTAAARDALEAALRGEGE